MQRLEQQKLRTKSSGESCQHLLHVKEECPLEQERKLSELREVMEAEMRTQLRRQAAAHTDHVQDVLKVLSSKMLEQETHYSQLSQEQLDNFTLDMNTVTEGRQEARDSHVVAEEQVCKVTSSGSLWSSATL
ncbi:MICOS complex subunit MIC60 [Lates japonicus]|uniref:MICOS complex subunit MIC60 n=1 Tax=Lates japonicus TaxID=270547 RepID=A0AAD3M796_LATJO|nr:MICOS complex subunit MIC60 [Lates japonicus]